MDEEIEGAEGAETEGEKPESLSEALWGDDAPGDDVADDGGDGEATPADAESEAPEAVGDTRTEAAKEEAPAEDADGDDEKLLESLSEKAQHRFRELASTNKDMERRLTGFQEILSDAQVTPQDMVDLLAYGKAIRTGDFDNARRLLAEQARALELASGKAVELADPLADFPDLAESVEAMELSRERAMELARVRRATEQMQAQRDAQARDQQAQQASQQASQTAFGEVVALSQAWRKSDLDWATKEPLMVERANFIQQNYPPSQWGQAIRLAYNEVSAAMQAARPAARAPSPLRPNAMGGGSKAPASMFEAMWGEPDAA